MLTLKGVDTKRLLVKLQDNKKQSTHGSSVWNAQIKCSLSEKPPELDFRKLCLFVDLLATGGQGYNTNKCTRLHLPLELNARKNSRLYNKLKQSCCTHQRHWWEITCHVAKDNKKDLVLGKTFAESRKTSRNRCTIFNTSITRSPKIQCRLFSLVQVRQPFVTSG